MNEDIKKSFAELGVDCKIEEKDNSGVGYVEKSIVGFDGSQVTISIINDDEMWKSETLEEVEDTLEKGYNFLRGLDGSQKEPPIAKTGSEIKTALIATSVFIKADESKHKAEMAEERKEVGFDPEGKFDEYDTDGLENRVEDMPSRYSYEQMYPNDGVKESVGVSSFDSVETSPVTSTVTPEIKKCMREYNDHARRYLKCKLQSVYMATAIKNLDDKRSYKLTIKEAAILGF